MIKNILIVLFLFISFASQSQYINPYKSFYISPSLSNLRYNDQLNYGYVFRSYNLLTEAGYKSLNQNYYFDYSISFGIGETDHPDDIYAIHIFIIPVKTNYAFNTIKNEKYLLYIGPSFDARYHFILIPQLHIGQLLWSINYNVGIKLTYLFNLSKKPIKVTFENNFLSLCSRPKTELDPEFQEVDLFDWIADGHANMRVGSLNMYDYTSMGIEFTLGGKKVLKTLNYQLNYTRYFNQPEYRIFEQTLSLNFHFIKYETD